jgi:predicted RNA-binding protein with PUA-like domain
VAYWILKTEPSNYSFADLERDGGTVWDGVSSPAGLLNIRRMHSGDLALVYHTGDERRLVGLAEITSEPYADPALDDPKRVVVDIRPLGRLERTVTLAEIKADPAFAMLGLVREGRLSVVPADEPSWQKLIAMSRL